MIEKLRMLLKRRVFLAISTAVIVVLIAPAVIELINRSIPRGIVARSLNCAVDGVYYPIDMMVVNELGVAEQRAEISGVSYSLLWPLRSPASSRVVNKPVPASLEIPGFSGQA